MGAFCETFCTQFSTAGPIKLHRGVQFDWTGSTKVCTDWFCKMLPLRFLLQSTVCANMIQNTGRDLIHELLGSALAPKRVDALEHRPHVAGDFRRNVSRQETYLPPQGLCRSAKYQSVHLSVPVRASVCVRACARLGWERVYPNPGMNHYNTTPPSPCSRTPPPETWPIIKRRKPSRTASMVFPAPGGCACPHGSSIWMQQHVRMIGARAHTDTCIPQRTPRTSARHPPAPFHTASDSLRNE